MAKTRACCKSLQHSNMVQQTYHHSLQMEVFNAPDSCQPAALLESTDSCATWTVWFPAPWSAQNVPWCSHCSWHWAELSWFSLEPAGEHKYKCAALLVHLGKAVPTGKGGSFSTGGLKAGKDILPHQKHSKCGWEEKECTRSQDVHSCRELPAFPTGSEHYLQHIFLQLKVYIQIPWQIRTCAIPDAQQPVIQIYWYVQSYLSSDSAAQPL